MLWISESCQVPTVELDVLSYDEDLSGLDLADEYCLNRCGTRWTVGYHRSLDAHEAAS